jgi:hypothetical protein
MVITGDCQHMFPINDLNNLEDMMRLDTNYAGPRSIHWSTDVQPVASYIELRTVVPSEMLSHPPATPL